MDVLALTSVITSASTSVYCQISVASALGTVTSKFVNFSDGRNVLLDFYSFADDNHGMLDWSSNEWFDISISNCVDYEVTNKISYQDHVNLDANPSSIRFRASFHDLNHLLSNDSFPSLDLSSRTINLIPHGESIKRDNSEIGESVRKPVKHYRKPVQHYRNEATVATRDKTSPKAREFFVLSADQQLYQGKCHIGGLEASDMMGSDVSALLVAIIHVLILSLSGVLVLRRVSDYLKKRSVTTEHTEHCNITGTATLSSGQELLPQRAVSLINERKFIHNRDTLFLPTDHYLMDASVQKEYYNMIENAIESNATDFVTWDIDSEGGSDCSINDSADITPAPRSSLSSPSSPCRRLSTAMRLSASPLSLLIENQSNTFIEELERIRGTAVPISSVDLVELAFLADWEKLSLAVPGGEFYDTDVTTMDSPHSSLNPSRDDGTSAINHEIEDFHLMNTFSTTGRMRLPDECMTEQWVEAALPDDRALHVDVQLSPHKNTQQTCLTPSEWKSVNDMPRTNRIPLTRRITPLKDRVKERTKSKDLIHRYLSNTAVDPAANVLMTDLVESGSSSNSSNVSVKSTKSLSRNIGSHINEFFNDVKANSFDGETNLKRSMDDIINCCGCSDISNGDEQTLADSAGANKDFVGKMSRAVSDNSLYSRAEDDDESEDDNESVCNSDSDNDLGHFYTLPPPLTASDNSLTPNVIPSSASLGYIVSYPTVTSTKGTNSPISTS